MKTVPLGLKRRMKICDCHFEQVMEHKWYFDGRYARRDIRVDGKRSRQYLHRLVGGVKTGQVVDHKNMDKLDNRCSNLRIATASQNAANSVKSNQTGYRGVQPHPQSKAKPWRAYIGGKPRTIGLFRTREEAAEAYNKEALKMYGDYARLNHVE